MISWIIIAAVIVIVIVLVLFVAGLRIADQYQRAVVLGGVANVVGIYLAQSPVR